MSPAVQGACELVVSLLARFSLVSRTAASVDSAMPAFSMHRLLQVVVSQGLGAEVAHHVGALCGAISGAINGALEYESGAWLRRIEAADVWSTHALWMQCSGKLEGNEGGSVLAAKLQLASSKALQQLDHVSNGILMA